MCELSMDELMEQFLDEQQLKVNYKDGTEEILKTNNKNTMNFIEQAKLEEFTKSSKVKELMSAISLAEKTEATFLLVADKLFNLVRGLEEDRELLNFAVNTSDIKTIETITVELEAKLEMISTSKLESNVSVLAKQFGIETEIKKSINKDDVRKSLGLPVEKVSKVK